ncbi:MAG: hypothetical protein ABRQ26_10075 [Syntrophomonadaceae bacterium]
MRRIWFFIIALTLAASLIGCNSGGKPDQSQESLPKAEQNDQKVVADLVNEFGTKFTMVSLQAPADDVRKSIQENYGSYVSSELMEKWLKYPLIAPGRLTSSPWPDRIEIQSTNMVSEDTYEVKGEVIEISSQEKTSGGAAAKYPITLRVKKLDNRWVIYDVVVSRPKGVNDAFKYINTQYGFSFSLPESWKGYSLVNDEWKGLAIGASTVVEKGPIILIRHPQWTAQNPRQDIPIMIFTLNQWNSLQKEEYHIGAAPIGPGELARNARYVLAIPARYNFAFPTGYEEVEKILAGKPLKVIE